MTKTRQSTQRWGNNSRQDDQQGGRLQILEAAVACYLDKGVSGTSIGDIARRAKISRSSVYRYFPNKQAVVQAVVEQEAEDFFLQLRRSVQRYRGDFPRFLKHCMLYTIEHGPKAPGQGLMMGINENIAISSHHYFHSERIQRAWAVMLRAPFDKARERGTIAPETDFDQLAAWSRRLMMSYILFPSPRNRVSKDIDSYVLPTLSP